MTRIVAGQKVIVGGDIGRVVEVGIEEVEGLGMMEWARVEMEGGGTEKWCTGSIHTKDDLS